jgi:hypothetical protein
VTADVGKTLSITATATGINYTGSITSASTAIVVSNAPPAPAGTILAYNLTSASDQNVINLTGFTADTTGLEAAVALSGTTYDTYRALAVDGRGRARIYVSGNAIANTSKVMVRVAAAGTVSAGSDKLVTLGASRALSIGDYYQGGVVAYLGSFVAGTVQKIGLITAETDQDAISWGPNGVAVGVNEFWHDLLGAGFANTNTIITRYGTSSSNFAVGRARSYTVTIPNTTYSDWFLPSKGEWTAMYDNRVASGVFSDAIYWSSSESNQGGYLPETFASGADFTRGGSVYVYYKSDKNLVRPVRYF